MQVNDADSAAAVVEVATAAAGSMGDQAAQEAKQDPLDEGGQLGTRAYWEKYAEDTVRSKVHLYVTPMEGDALVTSLRDCPVNNMKPTLGQTTIIVFYDEKLASEAQCHPWNRKCPARKLHFAMCIQAKLEVDGNRCRPGTLWVLPDHGKKNNINGFKKVFTDRVQGDNKVYPMHYDLHIDEESMRRRKRCLRTRILDQTEKLVVITDDLVSVPDRKRKIFPGSNRGRSWGFIELDPLEHVWHLEWATKQACLGDAIRPVGGKCIEEEDKEDDGAEVDEKVIKADTLVPFAWAAFPKSVYEELLHVNNAAGIIDFTPGDGLFAMAVLERGQGGQYCGWCHTEAHAQHLYARLKELVLQAMQTQGNELYNVQCAAVMRGKPLPKATTTPVKEREKGDDKKKERGEPNDKKGSKRKQDSGKRSKSKSKKKNRAARGAAPRSLHRANQPELSLCCESNDRFHAVNCLCSRPS